MKNKIRLFALLALVAAFSTNSVFACSSEALAGTWSASFSDGSGNANNGKTLVFTFRGSEMSALIQLTDSFSANYGPYFQSETNYKISLDEKTCTLTGKASYSTQVSLRKYEEPTRDYSLKTIVESRSMNYHVTISELGNSVLFQSGRNSSFTLTKNQ